MKRIVWKKLSAKEQEEALARPPARTDASISETVAEIFDGVKRGGWTALTRYCQQFDDAEPESVEIDDALVEELRAGIDPEDAAAIESAASAIKTYHEKIKPSDVTVTMAPGVTCRRVYRPIEKVGIYAPGGSAVLISSLMMTALPAVVAGAREIVVTTPPIGDDAVRNLMLFTAGVCGLKHIHFVGGAQAIAALTYGAGYIPKVDKIAGPGGNFVAIAKTYAASLPNGPAIDLPAGPSELMVIADESGAANIIAADLLSQAEHDRAAQVMFVTTDAKLADAVEKELEQQLETLPRSDIARASLECASTIIVDDMEQAADIANRYGPEHLSIKTKQAKSLADRIDTAGAIFLGAGGAEAYGDYNCGPSHVLPTDGAGRAWSGVSTETFMRAVTIQEITLKGAKELAEPAARLARLEGLEAHARAALARVPTSKKGGTSS